MEDLFEHVDTVGPFKVMLPVRSSGEAREEGLRLLTVDRGLVGHPLAITAHELG